MIIHTIQNEPVRLHRSLYYQKRNFNQRFNEVLHEWMHHQLAPKES